MSEPSDWRPLPGHAADEDIGGDPIPSAPVRGDIEDEAGPSPMRARMTALIAGAVALVAALWARLRIVGQAIADRVYDLRTMIFVKRQQDGPARQVYAEVPLPPVAPVAAPPAPPLSPAPAPAPIVAREDSRPSDEQHLSMSAAAMPDVVVSRYGVPPGYPTHPRPELLLPLHARQPPRFRVIWADPASGDSWLGRITAPIWTASDRLEARLRTLRWPEDRRSRIVAASVGLLVGASAVALAASPGSDGTTIALGPDDAPKQSELDQAIRNYILNHPEIIPEAMERLRAKETAKTIAENRAAIETPFAGAWAGARNGDVTLIEFADYSCGFCRASVADVDKLLAEDKSLKVVWREIPILGDKSEQAARLSLSAARQGHFLDFHRLMYATGVPDALSMAKVQKTVGMDPAHTAKDIVDPAIQSEIDHNIELARTLGISGTPTFIIGDRLLSGAVGYAALKQAIEDARTKKG